MNSTPFSTPEDSSSQALINRLKRQPSSPRTLFNTVMTVIVFVCAGIAIVPLVAVLWYVFEKGGSRLSLGLFTQLPPPPNALGGGFGNAFIGTLITVGIGSAIALVPQEARQAAVGLGATQFQTVARVVLPAALPPILTGVMLSVARASGETAPLIFTALFNNYWPKGISEPIATLSVLDLV